MMEVSACKGFQELHFRDNQINGGEDTEKIWNQMIILLFTQDMAAFLLIGYFQTLKHSVSCGIITLGK